MTCEKMYKWGNDGGIVETSIWNESVPGLQLPNTGVANTGVNNMTNTYADQAEYAADNPSSGNSPNNVQNFLDTRFTDWSALNPNGTGSDFRNDLQSTYESNGNEQLKFAIGQLDNQLGGGSVSRPNQAASPYSSMFSIPTNLFPTTISSNSSSSNNNSHSGINWGSPFGQQMMPMVTGAAQGAVDTANGLGDTLNGQYANMMRRGMDPSNFQGALNMLANRGTLNSTMGQNTMAEAGRGIARDVADKAFEGNLAAANAQMQLPSTLANVAALGNETNSSGGSSASGSSMSVNPLAPYDLMAQMMTY